MNSVCFIFEAIGPYGGIGKVVMSQVLAALSAGWQVTVVAHQLDATLQDQVEWLELFVPRRIFALKWLTARHYIRRALGPRDFDVIVAHQPQVADLADLFEMHYSTRVAFERGCFARCDSLINIVHRVQDEIVLRAEDLIYRRWNAETRLVFCSELLRLEHERLYGRAPRQQVLVNPIAAARTIYPEERATARLRQIGAKWDGIVVGYLGGIQKRKGFDDLVAALGGAQDIFLLLGGEGTKGLTPSGLRGHCAGVGLVKDTDGFYAACDLIIVPSHFDPCPMVVFEAVSRGFPVIATEAVGNLAQLLQFAAGAEWKRAELLPDLIRRLFASRSTLQAGCQEITATLTPERYRDDFVRLIEQTARDKQIAVSPDSNTCRVSDNKLAIGTADAR